MEERGTGGWLMDAWLWKKEMKMGRRRCGIVAGRSTGGWMCREQKAAASSLPRFFILFFLLCTLCSRCEILLLYWVYDLQYCFLVYMLLWTMYMPKRVFRERHQLNHTGRRGPMQTMRPHKHWYCNRAESLQDRQFLSTTISEVGRGERIL